MRVTRLLIAVAAVGTAASLILTAAPAQAHAPEPRPAPSPEVLSTAVAAPFNLEVSGRRVLVADGGLNLVGSVKRDGSLAPVVASAPGTSGVAAAHGRIAYTTTVGGPPTGPITASGLTIVGPGGRTTSADTLAYETAKNPDAGVHYGVTNPSACVRDAFEGIGLPVDYTGAIDSHAYSVAAYGHDWIVADAGANALLRVSRSGRISTVAVLPAQPATITAQAAAAFGLPDCVVGVTYAFESVPTDVEVGPDGQLYVTTLPGGPEDASLGARGSVYRVDPRSGRTKLVATGLLGATNLALSRGRIYVTEFFAGRVSVIRNGKVGEFLYLPGAVSIEAGPGGSLYAGTGLAGPPSVVRIDTAKGWRH